MNTQKNALRTLRAVVALLLIAAYIAGLIAMLTSNVQLGLILWVVSTLGGIGMLYWLRTAEKNREAREKAAADKSEPEA
ncbi:MAG: hypothetical protein IKQ80_00265 [Clostridia bacterium]|nr:hypothetical protein [Clostridia bacterium]MBR6889598.1 hypothetical protein [Clostridia bacterium]